MQINFYQRWKQIIKNIGFIIYKISSQTNFQYLHRYEVKL